MAKNLQEAMESIQEAIKDSNGPDHKIKSDNIEVIVDGEDSPSTADILGINSGQNNVQEEQEQEDKQQRARHPRRRQTSQQRIADVIYQKKFAESQWEQERYRREELEVQNKELIELANQKHDIAMANMEHAIRIRSEAAKHIYKEAVEDGDAERQADAQEIMSKAGAELAILKTQKDSYVEPTYQPRYQQNQYYQQQAYPQNNVQQEEASNPHYDEWLDKNHWFGQDEHLTAEANNYATELMKIYKYNQLDHLIGSKDFFAAVDRGMSDRYRVDKSPSQENHQGQPRQQTYSNNMSPVAPINRQSGYSGNAYGGDRPNQVRLSKEQCEVADRMDLRNKDNTPKSIAEKRKAYAYALANPLPRGLKGL